MHCSDSPLVAPQIHKVVEAKDRLYSNDVIRRIPLIALPVELGDLEIYLKHENLQPIGSFKLRGALTAASKLIASVTAPPRGLVTASAGNMAQSVAWVAKRYNLPCAAIVPEHAPKAKLDAIQRIAPCEIFKVPFDEWWNILQTHKLPEALQSILADYLFIHPVCDQNVLTGNATIGLEFVEDLPDVDTVIVPYGGGALSTGIASAVKAVKPSCRVFACEVETAAPLAASLQADAPTTIQYTPSFVDGIGSSTVLPQMWPLASTLLDGSLVVRLCEVADAIRLLVERSRIIAEGAGAAAVAAALNRRWNEAVRRKGSDESAIEGKPRKVVCVASGGGINTDVLIRCLQGDIPVKN